jgi:nitrogen fixation protein NifU and related proteins
MKLDDLYKDVLVKHYREQHGNGKLAIHTHFASKTNPTCGDEIKVFALLNESTINRLSYEVSGCTMCQSSASIMHDLCLGQTAEYAMVLRDALKCMLTRKGSPVADILKEATAFQAACSYPGRIRCISLCWDTLAEALNNAAMENSK